MTIKFVEIQNFRKLRSCRIEFSDKTTLFVGSNNSGKTSAMDALHKFFVRNIKFSTNDFTISNWIELNRIGEEIVSPADDLIIAGNWRCHMPSIDIWIEVELNQIHYITPILPSLDWNGELVGVRLAFEPKEPESLLRDFDKAYKQARSTENSAKHTATDFNLWPKNLKDFLDRKLNDYFTINAYVLDPAKIKDVVDGVAFPQILAHDEEPLEGNPLQKLISIKSIQAQRGFSDPDSSIDSDEASNYEKANLSSQLRGYYYKHIDPEKAPDVKDLQALKAIYDAQIVFDTKLKEGFKSAIDELERMGYPGFTNPQITISTKIKPVETLKHDSAVQYTLIKNEPSMPKLPERYNGLGYQNLISMVFKLINFRDDWMRVGKAKALIDPTELSIQPLQLVLIEEPEAHLHAQVQQVFIKQAYGVLRNHTMLHESKDFTTQLVVSTHSSNIAHAVEFSNLRYFRRKPAENPQCAPTSSVINLSEVFGGDDETAKFTTRYLLTTHCDLFFADAAVIIEGAVERMLLPHFIDHYFPMLNERYLSVLEIDGSFAYRLRPLIEHLGLATLIITDLDTVDNSSHHKSAIPNRGKGLITSNNTLVEWWPQISDIDDLIDLKDDQKVTHNGLVRVAYQTPVTLSFGATKEMLTRTFEDSFAVANKDVLVTLDFEGYLGKKIALSLKNSTSADELKASLFESIKQYKGKKAEFALELLFLSEPKIFNIPPYIEEGLSWLCGVIKKQSDDIAYEIEANKDLADDSDDSLVKV